LEQFAQQIELSFVKTKQEICIVSKEAKIKKGIVILKTK
jgi:hypothetical protein